MKDRYLDITYRGGRPLAGYLVLPREEDDRAAETRIADHGMVVDFAADGRPIGIEITAPPTFSLERLNRLLERLGQPPATADEARSWQHAFRPPPEHQPHLVPLRSAGGFVFPAGMQAPKLVQFPTQYGDLVSLPAEQLVAPLPAA